MKIELKGTDKDIVISKLTKILIFENIDMNRLKGELDINKEKSKEAIKYLVNEIPINESDFTDSLQVLIHIINISRDLKSQIRGDVTWNEYFSMVYFTFKVLAAIKKDRSFIDWLKSFFIINFTSKLKSPTIFAISIYFFVRTILSLIISIESGYLVLSNGKDCVKISIDNIGRFNKYISDDYGTYNLDKVENYYEIKKDDKKIGTLFLVNNTIYIKNNQGINVLHESSKFNKDSRVKVNLEQLLKTPIKENVSQSKKLLKEINIDYSNPQSTSDKKTNDIIYLISHTKDILTKSNNLGYMGLFTKIIIESVKNNIKIHIRDIDIIFQNIKELKPVLSELRSQKMDKKDITTFDSFEELSDSLEKLKRWRVVNNFMKKIPNTQKNLIWEDGFFKKSIISKCIILENIILEISKDITKQKRFLKKISSIKTTSEMVDYIYQFDDNEITFYSISRKIKKSNYAFTTYENESEGIIICAVFGYRTLKELTPGCNWCITRNTASFDYYTSDAIQYVIYRFDNIGNLVKDNSGIIGITIHKDFSIKAAHLMDDTPLYASRFNNGRTFVSPELSALDIIRYDENKNSDGISSSVNFTGGVIVDPNKFTIDLRLKDVMGLKQSYKWLIYKMNTNPIISNILDSF